MLTHDGIWRSVDRLAAREKISPSALARKSGLDPTTFNRSKRLSRTGKPRWPSTESIAKILDATSTPFADFVALMHNGESGTTPSRIPCISLADTRERDRFDGNGDPVGDGWDDLPFPGEGDPRAFALEVTEDDMAPTFRTGEIVIVSPASQPRRGDRVAVCTTTGGVFLRELVRRSARRLTLAGVAGNGDMVMDLVEMRWCYRVVMTLF
ncbi:MAG: helix-turn-helix transcriptional regulator [Pseudomonadota bacterium]|nr:helix-turn-helix transcriptional regulator [Pseudomonadota bacterium]